MGKLWEPNERYDESKPQSFSNMPYRRLYKNLTQDELKELLRDAKRLRWETLDLVNCGLKTLPEELCEPTDLHHLLMGYIIITTVFGDNNEISELPDSIGQLKNLQSLYLSDTQIRELPDSIGQLKNLQSLQLGSTKIRELPDSIGQLKNLQSLDLERTQIRELPDSIAQLKNLQSLRLSSTKISELPDSIGQLKNLQSLHLAGCDLKEIPYSLVQLGMPFETDDYSRDNCINLTDATVEEGDISLFSQPREVIEAYYLQQIKVRECKVIFLGDGAAGKSSLIQRMTEGTFDKEKLPTNGVNMTHWNTQVHGLNFTLRILDFGGQEIMFSMHRCFLTAHTVYVVVCESRDDVEIDAEASRWLSTVHAFAPGCPVILALNKADLNGTVSVNERDLKERNPALKCVLRTSAAVEPDRKFGVDSLMKAIRDEIPGAVNDYKMNADMLAVKQALEDMEDDYISSERYRELCADNHITDADLQYKLLGFFRDLGVAYFYESDDYDTRLESVRVLNPEWLTNGIYRLILRTREDGFLPHQEIKDTLKTSHTGDVHEDITYTPEETDFVLHVMRFFQISNDMGGGVEMIPMKMSKTPPEIAAGFPKANALHLRWKGTYLPNNLIHRLVIRKVAELDTTRVWRTGGWFNQRGGNCAIMAEMNEKELNLYVTRGEDCLHCLKTYRDEIKDILKGLNLHPREDIGVTADGQEGYVPFLDAVQQDRDGIEKALIPGTARYFNPSKLLRETYYRFDEETKRFREFGEFRERGPARVADGSPAAGGPPAAGSSPVAGSFPAAGSSPVAGSSPAAGSSLDDEKKKAEIENLHAETKKHEAEAKEREAEAKSKNLKITAMITLLFAIAFLIFIRPDLTVQLLEWLIGLLGG